MSPRIANSLRGSDQLIALPRCGLVLVPLGSGEILAAWILVCFPFMASLEEPTHQTKRDDLKRRLSFPHTDYPVRRGTRRPPWRPKSPTVSAGRCAINKSPSHRLAAWLSWLRLGGQSARLYIYTSPCLGRISASACYEGHPGRPVSIRSVRCWQAGPTASRRGDLGAVHLERFAYGGGMRGVPWWGVVSSAAAPVLMVGGWTAAASLQPRFD
jgi:hypothetical protein